MFVKGKSGNPKGRPKSLINKLTRPILRDFINRRELAELMEIAKEKAKTNTEILKFLLEQVFGRAPQPIEGGGESGEFVLKVLRYDDETPIESIPGEITEPKEIGPNEIESPKEEIVLPIEPAIEASITTDDKSNQTDSTGSSEAAAQTGGV